MSALERDMLAVLQDAAEYIKGQVDVVDGPYGEPAPNAAMMLMDRINTVLWQADSEAPAEPVHPTQAALEIMTTSGGSFVRALAECYVRADRINKEGLAHSSVNRWFAQYNELAERVTRGEA